VLASLSSANYHLMMWVVGAGRRLWAGVRFISGGWAATRHVLAENEQIFEEERGAI
jgi:hypothetical protein